jgi:uncharacterized glyoxalase superfamily protein PhnB
MTQSLASIVAEKTGCLKATPTALKSANLKRGLAIISARIEETDAMEQRLSLVTLGVKDLAQSRRFYEHGLGWSLSSASNADVVFMQLGGMALALYGKAALAEDAHLPNDGHGFGGITLAYNARTREEVDAVMQIAQQAGGRVLKAPANVFWGGYCGYFADPDGYPWEVAWNPHFTLNPDGSLVLP